MTNNLSRKDLDLATIPAIEWLVTHGALDSIPEDHEAEFILRRQEETTNNFEGLGRVVNWELYASEKLIAKRKPVKGGIVREYLAVGQWLHNFVLEVEHTASEVINMKKIQNG